MEKLFEYYRKLVRETDIEFYRYIYSKINWNSRMIGLTGPRGVGKTTLVLQHIKEKLNLNEALYVTAEDFYFASHRLLDLADAFVKMGGNICLSTKFINTRIGRKNLNWFMTITLN